MNEFKKIFSNLNIEDIGFNSNVSVIQLQLCFRACHSHFLKVFSICAHFQQVFQLSTCAIFIKAHKSPSLAACGAALPHHVARVIHQSQSWWFNPKLLLSPCRSALEQNTESEIIPGGQASTLHGGSFSAYLLNIMCHGLRAVSTTKGQIRRTQPMKVGPEQGISKQILDIGTMS